MSNSDLTQALTWPWDPRGTKPYSALGSQIKQLSKKNLRRKGGGRTDGKKRKKRIITPWPAEFRHQSLRLRVVRLDILFTGKLPGRPAQVQKRTQSTLLVLKAMFYIVVGPSYEFIILRPRIQQP